MKNLTITNTSKAFVTLRLPQHAPIALGVGQVADVTVNPQQEHVLLSLAKDLKFHVAATVKADKSATVSEDTASVNTTATAAVDPQAAAAAAATPARRVTKVNPRLRKPN